MARTERGLSTDVGFRRLALRYCPRAIGCLKGLSYVKSICHKRCGRRSLGAMPRSLHHPPGDHRLQSEHVANGDQPAAYGNPLNAHRLRVSIEANLAAKGIQRADHAAADCMIGYAMGSRQVFNDYYAGFGGGWGYGWGRRGGL